MEMPSISELDLPFEASGIMNYHQAERAMEGSFLVVGYLADDSDCENPMETCDGMGNVHSSNRHAGRDAHSAMQDALGLTDDWEPNLEAKAVQDLAEAELKKLLQADYTAQMVAWTIQYSAEGYTPAQLLEDMLEYFQYGYTNTSMEFDAEEQTVLQEIEPKWVDIQQKAWEAARSTGALGNRDSVMLDCYEHGGQVWSVSGSGMQCQWDTARGAGVWVPDDVCREEIDRRAPVYQKGRIQFNNGCRGNRKYSVSTFVQASPESAIQYAAAEHPVFENWGDAFAYLCALEVDVLTSLDAGRTAAAEELARECLSTYNDWLSGSCYGVVVATFANVATDSEDPKWEFVESSEVWGYIGDDYAMEEAVSGVQYALEALRRKTLLAA